MTAAVDRREPIPRRSADSPPSRRRERFKSPPKTSSSRRARSPVSRSRSRSPSPPKTSSSWRARSPPSRSRSPSSRTKRPRRSQAEREAEKPSEREHSRIEDRDRGRHRGREDRWDEPSERREARGRNDGGSSRPPRRECSASPEEQRSRRGGHGSRSPPRAARAGPRDEVTKSRAAELRDGEDNSVAKMKAAEEALEAKDKQKPSFELSGKLAEETNRVRGVTLLFTEPPDARKPDIRWRLYVFKAGEVLKDPLYVHRQSCYLFGRERRVADIPTDHPSCSKQHAVIQYRLVEKEQRDGLLSKQVRPYLMDLGSTNGTFINDNRIEPQRYYELFEKDTIKFGNSSREYVLLHENSME